MNFLSPWFLFGALAIAGPILFHLIRRVARERMPFSSLMFLRPTPPRVTQRRKLENIWLLLLRCFVLLLLAIGFARPFLAKNISTPASLGGGRQLLLLIDISASMRREGLWEKARARAAQYLEKISPADQIALVTFDRQPRTLVSFAESASWLPGERAALARQRLATISPGQMGTQLGLALTTAAEQFTDDSANKSAARRELVLITDLQEGAKLDGLQGHEWPRDVQVIVEQIDAKRRGNAGLEIVNPSANKVGGANAVQVRVTNARDSTREKFSLRWNAGTNLPMEIYLAAGQSRIFAAPKIFEGLESPRNRQTGMSALQPMELRLTGDEENFDNQTFYAVPESERVTIGYLGFDSGNDPATLRYYLQRVFSETPRRKVELISPANSFSTAWLNDSAFAVVPGNLSATETATLRNWLTNGKTALLILTNAQMSPTLAALASMPGAQLTEATGDYALLGELDFKHPIFAPFADPRFSDFTSIHFWKHRRWEIPTNVAARILAKFDDGSPALAQLAIGKGTLLVLTSGWHPADSQLAVSSKFPPLLQTMLDWSGAGAPVRFQFQTGDSIPSPLVADNSSVQWQKPDGKQQTLAAGTAFSETDLPGIYIATFAGQQRRFAVNLSLDESRTAPLSPDALARLGVPLKTEKEFSPAVAELKTREEHLQQTELENRQKLWRWLIAAVLAITLGEIILSGKLSHPSGGTRSASP